MKFIKTIKQIVDVKYLCVYAYVRYWEDATVNGIEDTDGNLIPCRVDDCWNPIIELETGRITNWPDGISADIHYKVCDAGSYKLLDESHEVISGKDGYVPCMLCPKDNGYGDYIIMKIDGNGIIDGFKADLSYFHEVSE